MAELPNDRITKFILINIGDYTICPILSILFLNDLAYETWLFEKFIFELEDSDSFKITCVLVKQLISLEKNDSVISHIYCLVSWLPICTPVIFVSASMKMTNTSVAVIYNSMRIDTPSKLLI